MAVYNVYDVRKDSTAWSKAPADVVRIIARKAIATDLPYVIPEFSGFWGLQIARIKRLFLNLRLLFAIPMRSVVVLQLPGLFLSGAMGCVLIAALHYLSKVKIIVIIHDIECVRKLGLHCHPDMQLRMILRFAGSIIVHNARMEDLLVNFGADRSKLVRLEVFDYLVEDFVPEIKRKSLSVVIAGNLNSDKARYLSRLTEIKSVSWCLYGGGFDAKRSGGANVVFMGSYLPDELPKKLNQSFGLVWDGDSIETCSNRFGEYLKINNPHKLSLYIAAGLPIIIWSGAAEAAFVRENNLGIIVDSLHDMENQLLEMSNSQYDKYVRSVEDISRKIRGGYFMSRAIDSALSKIKSIP